MSTGKHFSQGSIPPPSTPRGKVRLYSNRFCPYAQRVHLVLDAKNIPYDVVNINLINKPDWFFEKSPYGKVPALEVEHGDVIYESLIIADYLDEKYTTNQLHAKTPLAKAKDRLLIEEFSKVIHSLCRMLLHPEKIHSDDEEIVAEGLAMFERELQNRGTVYFGGNKAGMLDFMIWPWCERADLLKLLGTKYSIKKNQYKRLMEWKNAMIEIPSVKKSFLDIKTHTKFLHSFKAGVPDYDNIF